MTDRTDSYRDECILCVSEALMRTIGEGGASYYECAEAALEALIEKLEQPSDAMEEAYLEHMSDLGIGFTNGMGAKNALAAIFSTLKGPTNDR